MAYQEQETILLISPRDDVEAYYVANELRRRNAWILRCDTTDFPNNLKVAAIPEKRWNGFLRVGDTDVRLESITGVFCWHPTTFDWPDGMSDDERQFAAAEARLGLGGLLGSIPARWVNHPARIADAEYKPLQLQVAAGCNLAPPRTLLTNDADEARKFAAQLNGPLVYKPLINRTLVEDGEVRMIYTTIVDPSDLVDDQVSLTTHLFQEWTEKAFDVRCTVVSEEVFAVAIHAASERGHIDFRADYASLSYERIEPPRHIREGMVAYLRRMGLNSGSFDFVVTPEQNWVFLECNPAGMWAWLQEHTEIPIASALADFLTGARLHARD